MMMMAKMVSKIVGKKYCHLKLFISSERFGAADSG